MRDINLLGYLPDVVQSYTEFEQIANAENPEIEAVWIESENAFADQFISTSTLKGIIRRENMLKITPKASHTLEDRRFAVLTRWNERIPYTYRVLKDLLSQLCGVDGYVLSVDILLYEVSILVELRSKNQADAVAEMADRIIPENMIINVRIRYNQHEKLGNYTHGQLSPFTHSHIRNEVLT